MIPADQLCRLDEIELVRNTPLPTQLAPIPISAFIAKRFLLPGVLKKSI
jgi:hypothetical protein